MCSIFRDTQGRVDIAIDEKMKVKGYYEDGQDRYRLTLDLKRKRLKLPGKHLLGSFFHEVTVQRKLFECKRTLMKWGQFSTVNMTWRVLATKVRASGTKIRNSFEHSFSYIVVEVQRRFVLGVRVVKYSPSTRSR